MRQPIITQRSADFIFGKSTRFAQIFDRLTKAADKIVRISRFNVTEISRCA